MPKRLHSASDRDDDGESVSNQSAPKRTRKAMEDREINDVCQELYDALRAYKSEDDRIVCENFIRLPSKRTHTDYYSVIKQPIDFIRIQQKIRADEYRTLDSFVDDIQLLLSNAKHFYKKNSSEWRDANDLSKYFHSKQEELNEENSTARRGSRRNEPDPDGSLEANKKRRSNRSTTEPLTNGSTVKIEDDDSKSTSIDRYYFEEYFTAIYNATINERAMSDIFLFLPSRKFYPDYYLIVSKPIDLKMIAMKIDTNQYSTFDDMENDFLLMVANARKYNDPKSQIYKDACALRKMIITVRNELESASKTSKPTNDRLRARKREVLLSSEIANTDYPEEPNDEDVIRVRQEQQQTNDDGADSDTSSLGDEEDSFRILYNAVKTYKLGTQTLIDPFMKLPNRRAHQDYYEEIERPIAMSIVKNHIKKGQYLSLADLVDDLRLMFTNAMEYNQEGSLIYNSAKKLLDMALLKAHELGYDENKARPSDTRLNASPIAIKDEPVHRSPHHPSQSRNRPSLPEPSPVQFSHSQRGRPSKKLIQYTEENILDLYNFIEKYQEDDVDLIAPFLKLPSASEYPDYYESIENPVDMSMIKEKIDQGQYKREQDLVGDLNRMFKNAQVYNEDDSFIFKHASQLERVLQERFKKLMNKKNKWIQKLNSNRLSNANITKKSVDSPTPKTWNDKIHSLIQAVKTATDRHGRVLCTAFVALPSKLDYPDYYEIIQQPIDLKRIESRRYASIDELVNDFQQMFDNACLYNEPGSTLYRDALTLQQILFNKRKELNKEEFNVHRLTNLVQTLIWHLFVQTFNHQDETDRYYSDSFAELPEQVEHEPFDCVYTFDLIKQNLNQRRYRRLDAFQDDLFKVFERARLLTPTGSQVDQDAAVLQRYYLRVRDEMCGHGSLLGSPALLFDEHRLKQDIERNRIEKDALARTRDQNSTSTMKSTGDADKKNLSSTSTENSAFPKGETFHVGDFVYVEPTDPSSEPIIVCIESFERRNNEDFLTGLQFLRPKETYHLPMKKFLPQEVFLTHTLDNVSVKRIQGLCHVLHVKDYFKYQPVLDKAANSSLEFRDPEKDVYVCESRYSVKTKIVKKVKYWNVPVNERVQLIPRVVQLENVRVALPASSDPILHRTSTAESDSMNSDVIHRWKETIPYDSVINSKFNENLTDKKQFYEQVVISTGIFYRVGDYVYILQSPNSPLDKRSILRIDRIWKDDVSYAVSGPLFIRPCDLTNRDQLIITTASSYQREVVKCDGSNKQISIDNIRGKCSVLSLKHYCTIRLTEIPEGDVHVCESKYISDDHSLRGLSRALKKPSLSSKACADEIWTFRQELLLQQDTPGGPFKLIDDGSFMDVDDQTNSNHASHVDGDEHQSNHLTPDAANSSNSNHLNSSSIPNRNSSSSSRKNNRRVPAARAPCGYLVFASESRKRLIRDNPGIPFGEMSRMIGDQWRRLTATERDKFEEKARERAREQESQVNTSTSASQATSNLTANCESPAMPVVNPPRMVNGNVTLNGHYQTNPTLTNVHQINGNIQTVPKQPAAAIVTCPPRTQRLVHSEAYLRYIENLKTDNQFITDWPKQLKASMNNTSNGTNGANTSRALPSNWLSNSSPGLYNNVHEALWSMRDNMWSDVTRIRNVLSDEW